MGAFLFSCPQFAWKHLTKGQQPVIFPVIMALKQLQPGERPRMSPRLELACHLYGTGVATTQQEAAEMAGLSSRTNFPVSRANGLPVDAAIEESSQMVKNHLLSTHQLLQVFGREAVETLSEIMRSGEKEANRLQAARDLADRSAETSKIHRSLNVGVQMSREDAQILSQALMEGAQIRASVENGGEIMSVDQSTPAHLMAGSHAEHKFLTEEEKNAR